MLELCGTAERMVGRWGTHVTAGLPGKWGEMLPVNLRRRLTADRAGTRHSRSDGEVSRVRGDCPMKVLSTEGHLTP
jgi:hypothetical protein